MSHKPTILILGMGFLGKVLAKRLLSEGWCVRGTSRSGQIDIDGIEGYAFTAGHPIADEQAFQGLTHVLSCIPVIDGCDPVLAMHGPLLKSFDVWAGYVSATSVYTEADGNWVNEDSPTNPVTKRGKWRRNAEMEWQEMLGAEVFRAAGIYGPGRSPLKGLMEGKGRIVLKPGHQFNRIHVDDIARVLTAAMASPRPRRILNLADGSPCEAADVIRYAAELLGVATPTPVPFADAELSPMARSFYATSRKVDSSRIKAELGLDLLYPDYRSGMEAVLAAERMMGILPVAEV
jgi:nucleoside-diphosphate-sugar epimerase